MKVTLFRKVRHTKDGKAFDVYCSRLRKKDGTDQYVTVKFSGDRREDFNPELCPYIIEVDHKYANLSTRKYTNPDTGEVREQYTLWVKKYSISDEQYVDHSLDDFE